MRPRALSIGTLALVLSASSGEAADPIVGPRIEYRGLRPQQSEIDDVLSKSFGCQNQHGRKMRAEAGLKPRRCPESDMFQAIFVRELVSGADLPDFVRRHSGHCSVPATSEQFCVIEREVFTRSYMADPYGKPTNVFEMRTIFTIKIRVAPELPSGLIVDLEREDFFGSQTRG